MIDGDAVGGEVEGVDEVVVGEVGGRRLVCGVDGVVEFEVPDGEGLELSEATRDAPLPVLIDLAHGEAHLATTRTGGGDYDYPLLRRHVLGLTVALVAQHLVEVGQVVWYLVADEDAVPPVLEALLELLGAPLAAEAVDDDSGDG